MCLAIFHWCCIFLLDSTPMATEGLFLKYRWLIHTYRPLETTRPTLALSLLSDNKRGGHSYSL